MYPGPLRIRRIFFFDGMESDRSDGPWNLTLIGPLESVCNVLYLFRGLLCVFVGVASVHDLTAPCLLTRLKPLYIQLTCSRKRPGCLRSSSNWTHQR